MRTIRWRNSVSHLSEDLMEGTSLVLVGTTLRKTVMCIKEMQLSTVSTRGQHSAEKLWCFWTRFRTHLWFCSIDFQSGWEQTFFWMTSSFINHEDTLSPVFVPCNCQEQATLHQQTPHIFSKAESSLQTLKDSDLQINLTFLISDNLSFI